MKKKGFTLVEILLVVMILGVLSVFSVKGATTVVKRARDYKRVADIRLLESAMRTYHSEYGFFPDESTAIGGSLAGWEVSYKGDFLEALDPFIQGKVPIDPINRGIEPIDMFYTPRGGDGNYFYMYYNYNTATLNGTYYGCDFQGSISVIGFRTAEYLNRNDLPFAYCDNRPVPDPNTCPRGGIPYVCRSWREEFDYSILLAE